MIEIDRRTLFDFAALHPHLKDSLPEAEQKPTCPRCGGRRFFKGPQGGLSTNILCADIECRHWYNHQPGLGLDDLGRVELPENMDG